MGRGESGNNMGDEGEKRKDGGCNRQGSALISDLPCMHLDPGVNRLGLNIASVHQTDRRPVTPDKVFPICVILWPQEERVKKKDKKRSIHFSNALTHTHTRSDQIREATALVPCLKESLERSQSDYKTANPTMQMKEGDLCQWPRCVQSERNTSGKFRQQLRGDAEALWRRTRLFVVCLPFSQSVTVTAAAPQTRTSCHFVLPYVVATLLHSVLEAGEFGVKARKQL